MKQQNAPVDMIKQTVRTLIFLRSRHYVLSQRTTEFADHEVVLQEQIQGP